MANKKPHKRYVGCKPVTRTFNLVYNDRPLVQATVIKDSNLDPLKLQLDYWAGQGKFVDEEGYVGVRWTKEDLQHMLSILEFSEECIKNERQQQRQQPDRRKSAESGTQDQ